MIYKLPEDKIPDHKAIEDLIKETIIKNGYFPTTQNYDWVNNSDFLKNCRKRHTIPTDQISNESVERSYLDHITEGNGLISAKVCNHYK